VIVTHAVVAADTTRTVGVALIIAGAFGLLVALVVAIFRGDLPKKRSLGGTALEEKRGEGGADGEDQK
jgi:hypothetical protein